MSTQEEATNIFEKLYRELPNRYSFELGLCYTQTANTAHLNFKDDNKAERYYLKSLPLLYAVLGSNKAAKRQITTNRSYLTDIYINGGNIDKALEQLDAVLELDPNDGEAKEQKMELEKKKSETQ